MLGMLLPYALEPTELTEPDLASVAAAAAVIGNTAAKSATPVPSPASLSPAAQRLLKATGALTPDKFSIPRLADWMPKAQAEYAVGGVTVVRKLMSPAVCDALRKYWRRNVFSQRYSVQGVYHLWSEQFARHMSHQLKPVVEKVCGRRLRDSSPLVLLYPGLLKICPVTSVP